MSKVAVVYWSGTGNTEAMANSVAKGARESGGDVQILTASEFTADIVDNYDAIAFGCPSMGAEVLEEDEFQPMWDTVLPKLEGKTIALFGSYDWGDGEWMRNWSDECKAVGAIFASDFVICNLTPDQEAEVACNALGAALLKAKL